MFKHLMKGALFVVLFLVGSMPALGFEFEQVTVKVRSGYCRSNLVNFEGSGVLFQHLGEYYVLTSEHVLIHDNGDYCHSVSNDEIDMQATLLAKDWGRGLALLKLDGARIDFPVPDIEAFDSGEAARGDGIKTLGYPYGENSIRVHESGEVLEPKSGRHFLATGGEVLELVRAHGEFGMSGGPAFSSDGRMISGMLSHQYLALSDGRKTVGQFEAGGSQSHLLVVPSANIRHWLDSYFVSPDIPALFVRNSARQVLGQQAVYSSGYEFLAQESPRTCEAEPPGGIGGDPVGIGGHTSFGAEAIEIKIGTDAVDRNTQWYLPSRDRWLAMVRRRIYARSTVIVPFLLYRHPDSEELSKVCFSSLEEFFRKLASPHVRPVTLVVDGPGEPVDETVAEIQRMAEEVREAVAGLPAMPPESRPEDELARRQAVRLLERMATLALTLNSEDWALIHAMDVSRILDQQGFQGPAWAKLYQVDFDAMTRIRGLLIRVADKIEEVQI